MPAHTEIGGALETRVAPENVVSACRNASKKETGGSMVVRDFDLPKIGEPESMATTQLNTANNAV